MENHKFETVYLESQKEARRMGAHGHACNPSYSESGDQKDVVV
jgi:hypothetical protein